MGRRPGQLAAAEAVGETIELQPAIGLACAVANQRDGVADEFRLLVGQQFGAVADRRYRADQVMAQPRRQQLDNASNP